MAEDTKENPRCSQHQGKQKISCEKCFAYLYNSKSEGVCQPIPLYAFNGRKVAALWGNVLVKIVKGSKHMLHHPLGWACDAMAIKASKSLGAEWIHIWDTETNTIYESLLDVFIEKGIDINYRFGEQTALAIHYWTIVEPKRVKVE